MRRSWLILLVVGCLVRSAVADGPADGLLRLVPSDSGVILAVEDLRDRAREVAGSSLYEGLLHLPAVRTWMATKPFRKADRASRDVQGALGVSLETIRDDLVGDAVVLALQADPSGRPENSRGLLLARPRDRGLLGRLIAVVNAAQLGSGELIAVEPRSRGAVKYSARLFKLAGRPSEFYVVLDDGTFGWSNSELLLLSVIDRSGSGRSGLGDDPGFRKVRAGLADRPLASLFVNARFLESAMADAPRAADDRASAVLARYLRAVGHLGVSLDWRGGISLRTCEGLTPSRLDPWLKGWLTRPTSASPLPSMVSPSTVAVASAHVDFRALLALLGDLVPEADRADLDTLKLLARGIFLGLDPVAEVLPRLVPGAILAVEVEPDPAIRPRFPVVAAVGWSVGSGPDDLAGPVDNGLKTLLAFYSVASKGRADHLRVESKDDGQSRSTVLTDGLRTPLAGRVDRGRLVVGNSPAAVARFGTGQPPSILADLKARDFPDSETFAVVDLTRLVREVRAMRSPLARALAARSKRPVAAADRDLGDLIAVAELFGAATFTSTASADASEVRRSLKLIAR